MRGDAKMYTQAEKTTKNHTVADAVKAAECILLGKRIRQLNVTSITKRDRGEAITLAEVNLIADALVSDTLFSA
jgi:hypothetical protein